jgi:hypothetical protein
MPRRVGANLLFHESVEITNLNRYVRTKRREDMSSFGMTHAIIAAYVRTVAKYPALNRFVAGQRICDGFYYASVIKYFLRLPAHPEVLDTPPETIEQDIPYGSDQFEHYNGFI